MVFPLRDNCPAVLTLTDVDRAMWRPIAEGLFAGDVRPEANDTHDEKAGEEQPDGRSAG